MYCIILSTVYSLNSITFDCLTKIEFNKIYIHLFRFFMFSVPKQYLIMNPKNFSLVVE